MGLMMDAVFAELGVFSHADSFQRANQTLASVAALWPAEGFYGYLTHWTNRESEVGPCPLSPLHPLLGTRLALWAFHRWGRGCRGGSWA